MWLAGGKVSGGKVYGNWPGLAEADLYQGRDLAVTTDFRAVLSVVIRQHLGAGRRLESILPGFSGDLSGLETLIET
jgi:uncharacterized protein (DUF1501 family)